MTPNQYEEVLKVEIRSRNILPVGGVNSLTLVAEKEVFGLLSGMKGFMRILKVQSRRNGGQAFKREMHQSRAGYIYGVFEI